MKKCPRCGLKLSGNHTETVCPKCHKRLSFSERDNVDKSIDNRVDTIADEAKKIKIGVALAIAVGVVVTIIMINAPDFILFPISGDELAINELYSRMMLVPAVLGMVSFVSAVVAAIIYYIKRRNGRGSAVLMAMLATLSIISLFGAFSLGALINSMFNDELTESYRTVESIEIGSEKIPSVYSTLGKSDLLLSDVGNDSGNEEIEVVMDYVAVIYKKDFSDEELIKYREELLKHDYLLKKMNYEGQTAEVLLKDKIDEGNFYIIRMDKSTVTYAKGAGKYEEVLGKYIEEE